MPRTTIGNLNLRNDMVAHGKTSDGLDRLFLTFIPQDASGLYGTYACARKSETSSLAVWTYDGNQAEPVIPAGLGLLIESLVEKDGCTVWMQVNHLMIGPDEMVTWINIHFIGLPEIRDVTKYVQMLRRKINRNHDHHSCWQYPRFSQYVERPVF
jgi:hypothetical protein